MAGRGFKGGRGDPGFAAAGGKGRGLGRGRGAIVADSPARHVDAGRGRPSGGHHRQAPAPSAGRGNSGRGAAAPAPSASQPSGGAGGKGGRAALALPLLGVKQRRLQLHRQLFPHRAHVDHGLYRVTAHWQTVPQGTVPIGGLETGDMTINSDPDDSLPIYTAPEEGPSGKAVDARVLLLPSSTLDMQPAHPSSKIRLLVAQQGGKNTAYGGQVAADNEVEVCAGLSDLVKTQCGVDLSSVTTWIKFVEFHYKDRVPTVFYLPALWEASGALKAVSQAKEEEKTVKESYEEEVEEGEGDEKKTKTVTKSREVKKTVKIPVVKPHLINLRQLLEARVSQGTGAASSELCWAADALDEFIRREMGARVQGVLKKKQDETAVEKQQRREAAQAANERKRKRVEEADAIKRARTERNQQQRQQWEDEDQGMTDEEKKQAEGDRKKFLQEQRVKDAEEDKERIAKAREEDKEAAELEKKKKEEEKVEPEAKRVRRVEETDENALAAFRYFERGGRPGGTLPRTVLENVLLTLDDELSLSEVQDLIPAATDIINYTPLVKNVRFEPIPESPEKPKEAEKEKEAEAEAEKEPEKAATKEAETEAAGGEADAAGAAEPEAEAEAEADGEGEDEAAES
eukprot:Hpha_TRINITY_DN16969_c2_g6::TRINITY_DN16969_c2_g6_i1::g.52038::m.52038